MRAFMARRVLIFWTVLPTTKPFKPHSETDSDNPLKPPWSWRRCCRLPARHTNTAPDVCSPRSFPLQWSTLWGKTKSSSLPSRISDGNRGIGEVVGTMVESNSLDRRRVRTRPLASPLKRILRVLWDGNKPPTVVALG